MVAVTAHIDFFLKEFEFKTKFYLSIYFVYCVCLHMGTPLHVHEGARRSDVIS